MSWPNPTGPRKQTIGFQGVLSPGKLQASHGALRGRDRRLFDVTRTAVSQHLTVLKNAGLLSERRLATRRLYRARPEGLACLREFLDQMWASSLEIARDLVEADRGATDRGAAGGDRAQAAS